MSDEVAITGWVKLGGVIRDARARKELSQVKLAELAGVSRSWLARVEAGHRGAELAPLLRLFEALELTFTLGRSNPVVGRRSADGQDAASTARRAAWGLGAPADTRRHD